MTWARPGRLLGRFRTEHRVSRPAADLDPWPRIRCRPALFQRLSGASLDHAVGIRVCACVNCASHLRSVTRAA